MLKKIILIVVLLTLVSSIVACSRNGTQNNELIKATWIEPQVLGDIISVPISEVENGKMMRFELTTQDKDMTFMAYELSGEIYVKASICPPCQSTSFSLQQSTLVCDTCGTVFDAETGAGINGACVAYPKAAVAYEIRDGSIVMKSSDLLAAYQGTVSPAQPSEATAPSCHNITAEQAGPSCHAGADQPSAPGCCSRT